MRKWISPPYGICRETPAHIYDSCDKVKSRFEIGTATYKRSLQSDYAQLRLPRPAWD